MFMIVHSVVVMFTEQYHQPVAGKWKDSDETLEVI